MGSITAWEVAFVLLLFAVILLFGRVAQVGGAMRRSGSEPRTVVREEPVAAAPPVPAVICAACHASNVGTNKFCSVCGATLRAEPPSPPPAVEPPQPAGDVPTPLEGGPPTTTTGTNLTVPTNTCPSCATVNPPGQPFCGQCGTRLTTAAA
jgi:double zinc ribbon protein